MKMFDLTGQKAIVTGVGSPRGLGRSIALGLREAGAKVAVISRSARVFDIAREDGFLAGQADLTDRAQLEQVFADLVAQLGTLDILINNHGMTFVHEAESVPLEIWDRMLSTNLGTVFHLCQLGGRIMLRKGYGKIINMASVMSFSGGNKIPAYAASKGGLAQLTKALANEWIGRGINVNAIAPGLIETEMTEGIKNNPARRDYFASRMPIGRFGRPDDVQGTAIFLASHASDFISGAIIPVDGGFLSS